MFATLFLQENIKNSKIFYSPPEVDVQLHDLLEIKDNKLQTGDS